MIPSAAVGPWRWTSVVVAMGLCLHGAVHAVQPRSAAPPIVLLIAIDGWRWDYLDRMPSPALGALAARGGRADALVPVFPALTFPNHYTIVTGLRPARHGIISNTMLDPAIPGRFTLSDPRVTGNPAWWSGEPLWHTASRQGVKSATMFWPGSDVPIGGRYPTYWRPFQDSLPAAARTDQIIEWLRLPEAERPALLTLYFSDIDTAGHTFGPDAPELAAAAARIDAEIARLQRAVDSLGLATRVHWFVVSDHGMAALSADRVIVLDDLLDPAGVQIVDIGSMLTMNGGRMSAEAAYQALAGQHPHLHAYRSRDLPARFGLAGHPRLPAVVAMADEGWTVTTRARLATRPAGRPWGGAHGFDPAARSMGGLLVAAGPRLRANWRAPAVESVHLYALMCEVLGLTPAPNDGDLALMRRWLR